MAKPLWFPQLTWSRPQPVRYLDPLLIPPGTGLYFFTSDKGPLTPGNALYIGKSDGAGQTLRNRIRVYLRRFNADPGGRPARHAGMEMLAEYYRAHGGILFVRWAGVLAARDLEGSLIDHFDPTFNFKPEHRCGFGDDELIPEDRLYVYP